MGSDLDRPTRVRYAVLAVLCSLAFLTYLDRICIAQVQDKIAADLNFAELTEADEEQLRREGKADDAEARAQAGEKRSLERISWVMAAFVAGYFLFEIPGGWLGDVWGPRAVIFRIVLWWSLFTALTGSVTSIAGLFTSHPEPWLLLLILILVRFLFGLGEAGAYPNIGRVMARWFPFRQRGAAQGAIWMSSRFGGFVAPMVIAWLTTSAGGWREAFWTLGAVGGVWAVLFYLWFRNRPEEKAGVNAAECRFIRSEDAQAGSIYDESHLMAGVPWRRLLFSSNLWALSLSAAMISFCWYFVITFLPKYLKDEFKIDFSESAFMSGLPLLIGGASCLAGGRLSDWLIRRTRSKRWGRALPGLIGCIGAGLCMLAIPFFSSTDASALPTWISPATGVIFCLCLASAVQDMCVPCMWAIPADIGGRYAGTVAGWMNAVGCVGAFFSPILVARLKNAYGWNAAFLVFAVVYFLAALLWLRVDASEPLVEPPPQSTPNSEPGPAA